MSNHSANLTIQPAFSKPLYVHADNLISNNFNILASPKPNFSFECYLVEKSEDRFPCNKIRIVTLSVNVILN